MAPLSTITADTGQGRTIVDVQLANLVTGHAGRDAQFLGYDVSEAGGGGNAVGIGIVMGEDEQRPGPAQGIKQVLEFGLGNAAHQIG